MLQTIWFDNSHTIFATFENKEGLRIGLWTFVAPFFNFRFESFYLVFIVTIVELGAFVDQGFGRWPVQYNTREAASAKGDYYLNPFCTHFLLPAKSEKFDGMKLEYDKSISAQTPTVSTAKFRSDLEEYIRRGRFKRNKPGTQGSRPSFFHFPF